MWQAGCKDCAAERLSGGKRKKRQRGNKRSQTTGPADAADGGFEYSSESARRVIERGNSRSDRCERHRRAHRDIIRAIAVPYVDLKTIGEVPDPQNPTGPLGGLGPLPIVHREVRRDVDLNRFEFGMTDRDILQIIDGLATKQVAVIEAGTGTGKSTFMPFRLMNPPDGAHVRITQRGPIVVTEPRRAAATGVARFVGEELCAGHDSRTCEKHIGPGFPVGYQVSGEKYWDGACELIYVTDGTMINWVRDGRLARIGTVIVDEAHERSENIDIILAQLREQVRQYSHLRVIITSATLDKDFFVAFFGGEDRVFHYVVPEKKSFGYGVPLFVGTAIDDTTIADGVTIEPDGSEPGALQTLHFPGWSRWGPTDGVYPPEDLHLTTRALERLRCVEPLPTKDWKERMPLAVARQVVAIAAGTEWGDILAFLPTSETIRVAIDEIDAMLSAEGLDFDVYPLLATTPPKTSEKAIGARSRGEKRKIVVSSNLAETSLTVKGVRYVVDSGLICQPEWDPEIASGSYPSKAHSQSGLRQRWGRVGRDSPGWVFPLYTPEQFVALPRNTPAGSTKTNLETFYMKLISAGLDLESVALPANFVHESVVYDEDAVRSIDVFNRESRRAREALSLSGAVDADGHPTQFGRELERFPGDGSHALAIMLADQLACVHEVALALEVLGQGRLVGRHENCVLSVNRDWPSAWRVGAAQRHRALAIGCTDDLDMLLRVFGLWQSATDPAEWCQTWWVNREALQSSWDRASEVVNSLSAAMKGEASRGVRPDLAGRARAVLSRSMVGLRYERVDGTSFRRVGDSESELVTLGRGQLADAGDRILAFNRFRRRPAGKEAQGTAIVSHTVRLLEWAEATGPGTDSIGLDLILRVASSGRADRPLEVAQDPVKLVRDHVPVGSIISFRRSHGGVVEVVEIAEAPFQYPGVGDRFTDDGERVVDTSGFDANWDLHVAAASESPDEELESALVNTREQEVNDVSAFAGHFATDGRDQDSTAPLPALSVESAFAGAPIPDAGIAVVVGYGVKDDGAIVVHVDPVTVDAAIGDPARHEDLVPWQDVDVHVRGIVRDHERDFLQLDRADLGGRFWLDIDRTPGLDQFDRDFLRRLRPGSKISGKALPREDRSVSVTLRPAARAHLGTAQSEMLKLGKQNVPFYPATVVDPINQWGKLFVELVHRDEAAGLSHRFQLQRKDLKQGNVVRFELGQKVMVTLQPDRDERKKSLSGKSDAAATIVDANRGVLLMRDSKVRAAGADLPLKTVRELLSIEKGERWTAAVWGFFEDSLGLSAAGVLPANAIERVTVARTIAPLFRSRKRELEREWSVTLDSSSGQGSVEVSGPEPSTVGAAANAIRGIERLPRVVVQLPDAAAVWLMSNQQRNRLNLESATAIRYVFVEGQTIGVVGTEASAVRGAIGLILDAIKPVTGRLSVPATKNGLLIGARGENITRIRNATSCTAENPARDGQWIVRGPTEALVKQFFRLAAERVPSAVGTIVQSERIQYIEDTTSGTSSVKRVSKETVSTQSGRIVPSTDKVQRQNMAILVIVGAAVSILILLLLLLFG